MILRKSINKSEQGEFSGKLDDINESQMPNELCCFFRWIIQGPKDFTSDDKSSEVHKRALSLAQTTMSLTLTERQVRNTKSEVIHVARVMPQQLAIGIAVHQAIRSKDIINFLHGFGMSVEYNKILRVEAQIENNVLQRMQQNGGTYLSPDIILGRRVFFAADNVDFAGDTPDGKRNLHGTAMAIYQKTHPEDVTPELRLDSNMRQLEKFKKATQVKMWQQTMASTLSTALLLQLGQRITPLSKRPNLAPQRR
ncbi:uncharacterized protein LOC116609840 [Nematostella vectensis]|uniref:uncharacterized protein LOC116609840 n=1 Tax=Nematostella vectensis TaxID=45351 RepID=UPI0020772D56|nr:uncharacterized protein LOC116609840 [Nematostella vectensis]